IPSTIYNLLSDESKELLAVNQINSEIVSEANKEEIKEQLLPFESVVRDSEDDVVVPVYENIVKISTISKSSGFFHAVLKAIYPGHNQTPGIKYRTGLVKKFRSQLAKILDYNDEMNPGHTYYQTLGQMTQAIYPDLEDISLQQYKNLLNSDADVGQDIYQFTSYVLDVG